MKHDDVTPDRAVGDALRAFEPATPSVDDVHALARRITAAAEPLLARRRNALWWDYAASWARTLIPIGVTAAVAASACIVWAAHSATMRVDMALARSRAADSDALGAQQLLYSLVAPVEENVVPGLTPRPR